MEKPTNKLTNDALNSNISITVENDMAIMVWNGGITNEDYKEAHNSIHNNIREFQTSKWIFDYQMGKKILYEDLVWTISDWLPKLLAEFSKIISKIAVIVSPNIFSKISVKIIGHQIAKKGIDIAYFNNQEEAREWLETTL